jgi:hypothetical protein
MELKETVVRYFELINQRKLEREAIKFITAAAQQFLLESETVENLVPETSNANFWLVIELNDIGMQKWNNIPDEVMEFFSQFNGCDAAALTLEGSTLLVPFDSSENKLKTIESYQKQNSPLGSIIKNKEGEVLTRALD